MKYYISLPINGRKEKSFEEKYNAAKRRCIEMKEHIRQHLDKDAEFMTPFGVTYDAMPEANAMGKCITALLQCDIIALDADWRESKGCTVERYTAMVYGKGVVELPEAL